jgi:hypothetical protein
MFNIHFFGHIYKQDKLTGGIRMKESKTERFDYLMNSILNEDIEVKMELSKDEQEFFASIDLTEVLFV